MVFTFTVVIIYTIQGSITTFWLADLTSHTECDAIGEPNGANSDQKEGGKVPNYKNKNKKQKNHIGN